MEKSDPMPKKKERIVRGGTKPSAAVIHGPSLLTDYDISLFREGNHFRLFEKLGAHLMSLDGGEEGTLFSVWAPSAKGVSVKGDFNQWDRKAHPLEARWDKSGIWEGFIPGVGPGALYKYAILPKSGPLLERGDPFAARWEKPPRTASMVWALEYLWKDGTWMKNRAKANALGSPWSVYEVHLGSWRRPPKEQGRLLSYRELAEPLTAYVKDMGFTHVEFLPLMEHPFYGSWGYQTTGYFAPTGRYGSPQDFMFLIDTLHRAGIGVILDWVPSHFPTDAHGLASFDGSHLFEHRDPRQGFHPDWKSAIFNYGRNEVRSFLISSALFWMNLYHADGLRVDAVASMLYLDYSRKEGEWIPNVHGGRENLDAISFLRELNKALYAEAPATQTLAEESTAWPMVSRPAHLGGLGFGMKWNMGWMHDSLDFFAKDPIHRKYHFDRLTFSLWYAFTENFMLPLSHDETVYGKGSLLARMPGDEWQRFANLRLLFGWMFTHPGKKLLFMGGEFGQWDEWNHDRSLDWHLLEQEPHRSLQTWVRDLNRLYTSEPALFATDFLPDGFQWVDFSDKDAGVISYLRLSRNPRATLLVVCNLTPIPRENYRVGVPEEGFWEEILNSDAGVYGGNGGGNLGGRKADPQTIHGRPFSLNLYLPPLSLLILKRSE
jgi:1,4-alpha-glucan branching enzyme